MINIDKKKERITQMKHVCTLYIKNNLARFKISRWTDNKIHDIYDIGKTRAEATKNRSLVASGVEMRDPFRTFTFYRASRLSVAGIFHRGAPSPDDAGRKEGRSSDEVVEQGDGDEVHLAEGTAE